MNGPGLNQSQQDINQSLLNQLLQQQLGYSRAPAPYQGNNNYSTSGGRMNAYDPFQFGQPSLVDRIASPYGQSGWPGGNRRESGRIQSSREADYYAQQRAHTVTAHGVDPNTGKPNDRRMDKAADFAYTLGYINDENYNIYKGDDPAQSNQRAKIRDEIGTMMNKVAIVNEAVGGQGDTNDISIGANRLARSIVEADQGNMGNTFDDAHKRENVSSIQRQFTKQMLDNVFNDKGQWQEQYGSAGDIGAVLDQFSKGGGLDLNQLTQTIDGKEVIDPQQFKTKIGDNVKKMVDTLDALGAVYENLDVGSLMQIGGIVTGLDPSDIRNAGRINATVRQTMMEAERFGKDPKEYINMIQSGASQLAGAGYNQQASGMISQQFAAMAGVEGEMQRNLELRPVRSGMDRSGFRAMSTEDIHSRNMLNMSGALSDKQLANTSLGLTEILQSHEMNGDVLTEEQEKRLRNMINYGPESKQEMVDFASELQKDTGYQIFQREGTAEQRMDKFQARDTDNFRKLMQGGVSATNRTLGWQHQANRMGLGGVLDDERVRDLGESVNNIGGENTAELMSDLIKAQKPGGDVGAWAAQANSMYKGMGANRSINRSLKSAGGRDLATLTNDATKVGDLTDEEKNALLESVGKGDADQAEKDSYLNELFVNGQFREDRVIDEFAQNKTIKLQETVRSMRENELEKIKDDHPNMTPADQNKLADQRVAARAATLGSTSADGRRNSQVMPDDLTQAKTEHEQQQTRAYEAEQTRRRDNRLDKFDVNGGGFWQGFGDGTNFNIDDALSRSDLTHQDLRDSRGRLKKNIREFRDTTARRSWVGGKTQFLGAEDGADGADGGILASLTDEGNEDANPLLDNLAVRWGTEGNTDEEKRTAVRERLKKLRIAARKGRKTGEKLSDSDTHDMTSVASEVVLGNEQSHKDFRGSSGLEATQTDEVKKARALQETLARIEASIVNTSDNVQRVTFDGPLTAKIINDGGLRIVLDPELQ